MKGKLFLCAALGVFALGLFGQIAFGQTIIRRQDFDANQTWGAFTESGTSVITANGTIAGTTNPGAATYGAASASNTTQIPNNDANSVAKGTQNGNLVLTSPNIPVADFQAGANDLYISFRIAAIGLANNAGLDQTDTIAVRISLDNGPFSEEAIVRGNNNAAWNYNVTGAPTVVYDGNNTVEAAKLFTPVAGSTNDPASVTKLTIVIPDAVLNTLTTGVRIRVELTNNNANELWLVDDFIAYIAAATAAPVSVGGRVTTADGRGIGRATVVAVGQDGIERRVLTGPFGYYRFEDLPAGQTFVIQVRHKRYDFEPRALSAVESLADFDFTPLETGFKQFE
jgi:hypothetical protein